MFLRGRNEFADTGDEGLNILGRDQDRVRTIIGVEYVGVGVIGLHNAQATGWVEVDGGLKIIGEIDGLDLREESRDHQGLSPRTPRSLAASTHLAHVERFGACSPAFHLTHVEGLTLAILQSDLIGTFASFNERSMCKICCSTLIIKRKIAHSQACGKMQICVRSASRAAMLDDVERYWANFFPAAFAEGPQFRPLIERLRPDDLSRHGVRNWILDACKRLQVTPTEIARRAEIAPSTLNRFLKKTDGRDNLSANTIDAVATAILILGSLKALDSPPSNRQVWTVLVIAQLPDPSVAVERIQWGQERDYELKLPLTSYSIGPPAFGIELDHPNQLGLPRGSILVCSPAASALTFAMDGQVYLVHSAAAPGFSGAYTELRQVQSDPSGKPWLMPLAGSEGGRAIYLPDFQKRLTFEETLVSFCVVGMFSPAPWTLKQQPTNTNPF